MPAQKRSQDSLEDDPPSSPPPEQHDSREEQPQQDENESDWSRSSSCGDKDDFVTVKLSEIRKEVQCPICLGIIRKTRTVMECLHRFCRVCIDKSMRMGNNECPACRTHCASRRSLRDDPNYDALIAALYPDIDKYEEEEMAFHEEEKARNKQIQASIAQTFRRQTEALSKKKITARATAAAYRRSQGKRRNRTADLHISDNDEDTNGYSGRNDMSSDDDVCTEVKPKRSKRWGGARFSQPLSTAADGEDEENDSEGNKDSMGVSFGFVGSSERLAWGKGGTRSHTRYGNVGGVNVKNARNNRLLKLVDCLRNFDETDDELDIHIMLVSFDEERMPSLQRPYLSCNPSLSVRHLCQYIALQTQSQTDDVEILMVKELDLNPKSSTSMDVPVSDSSMGDTCKDDIQTLDVQETLGRVQILSKSNMARLLLAYRPKSSA